MKTSPMNAISQKDILNLALGSYVDIFGHSIEYNDQAIVSSQYRHRFRHRV